MNYVLDIGAVTHNLDKLWDGLLVTLQLTIAANVIGVIAGFLLALLVLSPYRLLSWPATLFVEFFRCTPAIVQMRMRERAVGSTRSRPKRVRRSTTGMTSPRRLITPSTKEGARGTGVMRPTRITSRTSSSLSP